MNSLGFNKQNKDTKVVIAMSGGVDSSVAATMLKKEGYDIIGITMKLYSQTKAKSSKSCCAGRDIEDAKKVAEQHDFPHITLDYQDKFFSGVIDNFIETYADGQTPVPCIQCNQTVKFRDLLNEAKAMNADTLVTGHYVRRLEDKSNVKLFKAKDASKDQSYFLFATLKDQLDYLRFPLGNYLKSEIRDMAKSFKLKVSDKPDSQDICFVTSSSYRDLINKLKPDLNVEGNFLDSKGNILGRHKGIVNYTIGQRKGVGIGGYKKPLYVIDINKTNNLIVLGEKKHLEKTKVQIKDINWIADNVNTTRPIRCSARIRSNQKDAEGILSIKDSKANFIFNNKINSTSPGQACVFYLKDQVLGGGWIT